jgi:hypothetical protein
MIDPSTAAIVFVVLCFLIVVLKASYDYVRFTNAHEKFISNYKTKLSELSKIGKAGLAIAAAGVAPAVLAGRVDDVSSVEAVAPILPKRKRLAWVGGQPSSSEKRGRNNCLFDATIEACGLFDPITGKPSNSQELRERCDVVLKEQGLPLIPHGEPAGEQYLQALSFVLKRKIKIYKGGRENFVAEIKHSDVDENVEPFSIVHTGSQLNGHWVAY